MLSVMESRGEDGQPIPWEAVLETCNLKKGTGGKRLRVSNVILVGGTNSNSSIRNQNRYENFTRNFRSVDNEEIRQFHPLLVETFNGVRVTL